MDEELLRFERSLGTYPDDRALPDVERVLADADVDASLLVEDERARKLWLDALTTRPFGDLADVRSAATEVELLVLEVRQVTLALRDDDLAEDDRREAVARVAWVRERLDRIQRDL